MFLGGEVDAWFMRNHSNFKVPPSRRLLGEWCNPYRDEVKNILEIGAGNGVPLAYLCDVLDVDGLGIEPPQKA